MTFGLNFQNMFNMNTMMNLGSMVGMGGFGGYSTGINPFGSVFSFYGSGSGSGCCTPNYSTRGGSTNNSAWGAVGTLLGYAGVALGTPLLIKGGVSLYNSIKNNSNSSQQASTASTLNELLDEEADLLAEVGKSKSYIIGYNKDTDADTKLLNDTYNALKGSYNKALNAINEGNKPNATDAEKAAGAEAEGKLASLKKQMDDAKKAYDDYVAKMEQAKAKLDELEPKIKAEREKLKDLQLDELDGCQLFSSDEKRLNTLFDNPIKEDSNDKNKITGYGISEEVTDADFRAVIRGYRKANDTGKKEWKVKFDALIKAKYLDKNLQPPTWLREANGLMV